MHELSIALSILDLVEAEADRRGGVRVLAVHLKLGPLSGVVPEALTSAFELAREGSSFDNCRLVINEVPIVVYCPMCKSEQEPVSIQCLCCSQCGTPTPQVVHGPEMEVSAMEIADEYANAPG